MMMTRVSGRIIGVAHRMVKDIRKVAPRLTNTNPDVIRARCRVAREFCEGH
jgi:hypothetical protein